jgi:hypothetical protein
MRIPKLTPMAGALTVALALAASGAALASSPGDVKVKNPDGTGDHDNEPHVGCTFFVEGFNMIASSGSITFEVWAPSGHFTLVHATGAAESWTSDGTDAHGHHSFLSGPFSLPMIGDASQGTHYKVFVSDGAHVKTKVFWTKCATPPTTPPTGPTCEELKDCHPGPCGLASPANCTNQTTPPTQVPFFPTGGSLALGALGAAGAVGLAVARRRS